MEIILNDIIIYSIIIIIFSIGYTWFLSKIYYTKRPWIVLDRYIRYNLFDIDSDIQSKARKEFVKELKRMIEDYEIKWE